MVFSLFLLFPGLLCLVVGSLHVFRTMRWSTTTATITNSRIRTETDSETGKPFWDVVISFKYKYDNVTYTSEHEEIICHTSEFDEAKEKLSNYPEDRQIRVWCNPKKPQQHVIKEGFADDKKLLYAGLALIGAGLVFMLLAIFPD